MEIWRNDVTNVLHYKSASLEIECYEYMMKNGSTLFGKGPRSNLQLPIASQLSISAGILMT